MYFLWQNTSLRPHSLTDMLVIIRLPWKSARHLTISFFWTFPLKENFSSRDKKSGEASEDNISVCAFCPPPLSLFNALVFPHASPHLLIWKLCSVITWDGGGFMMHFALCSFPPFPSCLVLLGYLLAGFVFPSLSTAPSVRREDTAGSEWFLHSSVCCSSRAVA